ncbi:MAG TPA: cytochrome c3 family protein [Chthonomonadaceae bacterium]|nr:cytochrome c3 family protein [Chthonomonadaceae bacterium]
MRLPIRGTLPAVIVAACLTILLLLAAAQEPEKKPDPHASGRIAAPPGADEVTYCNSCHKTGCTVPHPERVKQTWAAQGRVVLDAQGNITCGSCHTHSFRHRSDAFLARDQKGLCNNCHYGAHAISDVHTTNQKCETCHTRSQAALAHATPVETHAIKVGVDTECLRCHYDGPVTHPIGIPNTKKKAPDLPLSAEGNITCVTCHIGHKQQDRFGVLLRKDNRRGGLCLSCHDDL